LNSDIAIDTSLWVSQQPDSAVKFGVADLAEVCAGTSVEGRQKSLFHLMFVAKMKQLTIKYV